MDPQYTDTDFLNSYLDTLLQQNVQQMPQQTAELEQQEEQDPFIQQMYAYDDEQNAKVVENNTDDYTERFTEYDNKIAELQNQLMYYRYYADSNEGQETISKLYDPLDDEVVYTPTNNNDPINFKSSGQGGLTNVGVYGKQIGNDVANALGYTPTYNSIYRTKERNKAVGGVENSRHLTGDAVDIKPADFKKLSNTQVQQLKQKYKVINEGDHFHLEPK